MAHCPFARVRVAIDWTRQVPIEESFRFDERTITLQMRQVAECKASSMINQCYITIFQCILFFGGIKNNWREIRAWCAQKNCSDDRHLERELSVNYTLKPEQVKGWKALNNYSTCLVDWRTKCSSVIANKPFICFPSIWNATPTFSGFEKMSFWHRDYKACIFKSDGCYNSHKKQGKSIVFFSLLAQLTCNVAAERRCYQSGVYLLHTAPARHKISVH